MAVTQVIQVREFGGANFADTKSALLQRSHVQADGGWQQQAPMEFEDLENMDFRPNGLLKRLGSSLLGTITFAASDTVVLDAIEFVTNGGTRTSVAVTDKSIYFSTDGAVTWTRMSPSGGGNYTHNATVSKCSFAVGDGRLFIGLDGNNKIQVYRTGTALDAQLDNGNTYTAIYSGSNAITGVWGTGYYQVAWFQSRLIFNNGNSIIEYTPAGAPWDRANGGFDEAKAGLIAMKTFTRRFGNELTEVIFYNTHHGCQIKTGFDISDTIYNITGTHPTLNHRCLVASQEWIVYPTLHQTIEALNPQQVIDLGRRLKTLDGTTAILDTINLSSSQTNAFGFWNEKKKQVQHYIVNGSFTSISNAIVTDFQLGEPVTGEGKDSFERHTRHLIWSIKNPATNAWFAGMYQIRGSVIGFTGAGSFYQVDSGLNDLGSLPVLDDVKMPDFTPFVGRNMQWRAFRPRFAQSGNWNVHADFFMNEDTTPTGIGNDFLQLDAGAAVYDVAVYDVDSYAVGGNVNGFYEVDLHSESLSIEMKNQATSQDWQLTSFALEYTIAEST